MMLSSAAVTNGHRNLNGRLLDNERWSEVTKVDPCPICRKPDWCRRSPDGSFVACRRDGTGAAKQDTYKDGGVYWLHSLIAHDPRKDEHRASADLLDRAYSIVIAGLPLSQKHRDDLRARGLSDQRIDESQYRSYAGQKSIGAKIREELGNDDARLVPGMRDGEFVSPRGLLIPIRNIAGQIVALKVRSDRATKGKKYLYVTSQPNGPGPGSPVHVPTGVIGPIDTIRVTEGEPKADVAYHLDGTPTIAIAGAGLWMSAIPVLKELGATKVRVALDADSRTNRHVAIHLKNCVSGLVKDGFNVELETWDIADGKGIDDLLLNGKRPEVLRGDSVADFLDRIRTESDRPQIIIGTDEHRVVSEAIEALSRSDRVFERGYLAQVICNAKPPKGIKRPADAPRIVELPQAGLREELTKVADWWQRGEEGSLIDTSPPAWAVTAVQARGQWPSIRRLEAITHTPVLRADGTVLQDPGYDADTGLLFKPEIEFPRIPTNPTRDQASAAALQLLDVVGDFPFSKPIHRSAWLAGLLTPLSRHAYHGPAPLILIDANAAGVGKGLCVDVAGIIANGGDVARMSEPKSDSEMKKIITSIAVAGERIVLIDNIAGTLGGPSLDAALTSTKWTDRLLGGNEMATVPLLATWFGTGNNCVLNGDTYRRTLHIRLESQLENPEEREGFKYPNLLEHVRQNRGNLTAASLTILAGYCAAGCPNMNLKPWGSYEAWSDLVRSAVVWVGMPDPGLTRRELSTSSDPEATAFRAIAEGWSSIDPSGRGLTTSELVTKLHGSSEYTSIRDAILQLSPKAFDGPSGSVSLGKKLDHLRNRVASGKVLEKRSVNNVSVWLVKEC